MSTDKNFEKVAKFLSDNMDTKERDAFFAWVDEEEDNKQILDDSTEIWEVAEEVGDFEVNMEAAWGKMDQQIQQKRHLHEAEQTLTVVSTLRPLLKVAAAVLVLLMAGIWIYDSQLPDTIVSTRPTEKTTIGLPDGSEVWLNENSTIKYRKDFQDRVVYLEGEAFFKVAKKEGATFEIYAADSKTTVLGTQFNVRAYPSEQFVEVAVEEGKVLVESDKFTESKAILTKKEYAIYTKASQEVQKAVGTQANAAAWKKRKLDLREARMEQAIIALERYFSVDIIVENADILNCNWGKTIGTVSDPDLKDILETIKFTTGTSYKKTGNTQYSLSGEGCE